MDTYDYIRNLKKIHNYLIKYIDSDSDIEENYENFMNIISDSKIKEKKSEFRLLLCFMVKISNFHLRMQGFFDKILQILNILKNEIQNFYSNNEIYKIFKSNKRLLLFLIESKILKVDEFVASQMSKDKYRRKKYPHYFFPEIKQFFDKDDIEDFSNELIEQFKLEIDKKDDYSIKNFSEFNRKRKIGENDSYVSELIRNDSIEEFITYVNKTDLILKSKITESIFETNSLLLDKDLTLIQYSVFFGSIQIFKYLHLNEIELNSSLWLYSIHGFNQEIFNILEQNHIEPNKDKDFFDCLIEAIKCHHNDVIEYIQNNNENKDDESRDDEEVSNKLTSNAIKFYNFALINEKSINRSILSDLIYYNYIDIVKILIKNKSIDLSSSELSQNI